jgi:hypothetical protein
LLVKILAKFLLSSVFVFLPAVGCAQNDFRLYGNCPFPPHGVYIIERDNATIVEHLEDGQNCLNDSLMKLKLDVEDLQSPLRGNDDLKTEILKLQDQLAQTKLDLRMDETKIETLQHSYDMLSHLFDRMLNDKLNDSGLAARKPVAPASKPKASVSKPKAPVNKQTPAIKEGTH